MDLQASARFRTPPLKAFGLLGPLLLGACTVPPSMSVRSGVEPQYADVSVRFRTNYYFRVFDICSDPFRPDGGTVMIDSLYRFQMTGKANSLGNKVHFESGSLKKDQIEPFGTSIRYDENAGGFRVRSRDEINDNARRAEIWAEINALREQARKLRASEPIEKEFQDQIKNYIKILLTSVGIPTDVKDASKPTPAGPDAPQLRRTDAETKPPEQQQQELGCDPPKQRKRGFQVLGPEGFRTFDPDERLLMVMSASPKPLISALQQTSERIQAAQRTSEDPLRLLVGERARIIDARSAAKQAAAAPGATSDAIVKAARDALRPTGGP